VSIAGLTQPMFVRNNSTTECFDHHFAILSERRADASKVGSHFRADGPDCDHSDNCYETEQKCVLNQILPLIIVDESLYKRHGPTSLLVEFGELLTVSERFGGWTATIA
jgi:hypothetical protein